jgi:CzcA family heavy metal efflux pump
VSAWIHFALAHRRAVALLALLLSLVGVLELTRVDVDVFPDLDRPGVTVMTHIPGLSPEETEARLTNPIEAALRGTPGVEAIWSASSIGLSHVHVVFGWNQDQAQARARIQERLTSVQGQLPKGANPILLPFVSVMGEVDLVGLSSIAASGDGAVSPAKVRELADRVVRPRLLALPGVAQVLVIGGEVQELQIQVDPQALEHYGLTLVKVREAVAKLGQVGIGGILPYENQEYLVRVLAEGNARDLANAVVADVSSPAQRGELTTSSPAQRGRAGRGVHEIVEVQSPVLLSQVAKIKPASILKRGSAGVDGGSGVILSVYKAPSVDSRRLSRAIGAELGAMRGELPPGVKVDRIFKQADFIQAAIDNVLSALREGGLLVVAVVLLFLASLRASAITLTALPVSLLLTLLLLEWFGISINTMTLGGLCIGVGQLVDDAVVDVENVWRRLRENRKAPSPRPVIEVIASASVEVRESIVYATLVVVLSVVPMALLSGVEGRLFRPLVEAYVIAVLVSLLVSLTLTPALCALWLPGHEEGERESPLVAFLKRQNQKLLRPVLRRPWFYLAGATLLCAVAVLGLDRLPREFLPPFNEGTLTINLAAVPGITLSDSDRLGSLAERLLLEVPEVVRTGRRTGRAELDTHSAGVHQSEIEVELREGRPRPEVEADIRRRLSALPGMVVYLGQPISHRLEHLLEGMNGQIVVRVFGHDPLELRRLGESVERTMAKLPGIVDLQLEKQLPIPELLVQVDRPRAALLGLNAGDVAQQAQDALYGQSVGSVAVDGQAMEVRVKVAPEAQATPEAIARLPIARASGGSVPLGEVAAVREGSGLDYLNHDDGRRFIAVTANVAGGDASQVAAAVERAIARDVVLPAGTHVQYGGVWPAQRAAQHNILLYCGLAFLCIALALLYHFRSVALALLTLFNIPLSLIGSVGALVLSGEPLSVASALGFVAVCGIASRNTILLLSHYLHLIHVEGERFGEQAIVRGSLERLTPMLMTALTAGLALLPLIFSRQSPGKEILGPVAVVIAGGLCSSTLLDLVVTPAAFLLVGRRAAGRASVRVLAPASLGDERSGTATGSQG